MIALVNVVLACAAVVAILAIYFAAWRAREVAERLESRVEALERAVKALQPDEPMLERFKHPTYAAGAGRRAQ